MATVESSNWTDISARCASLDQASVRITGVDLTCADNSGQVSVEIQIDRFRTALSPADDVVTANRVLPSSAMPEQICSKLSGSCRLSDTTSSSGSSSSSSRLGTPLGFPWDDGSTTADTPGSSFNSKSSALPPYLSFGHHPGGQLRSTSVGLVLEPPQRSTHGCTGAFGDTYFATPPVSTPTIGGASHVAVRFSSRPAKDETGSPHSPAALRGMHIGRAVVPSHHPFPSGNQYGRPPDLEQMLNEFRARYRNEHGAPASTSPDPSFEVKVQEFRRHHLAQPAAPDRPPISHEAVAGGDRATRPVGSRISGCSGHWRSIEARAEPAAARSEWCTTLTVEVQHANRRNTEPPGVSGRRNSCLSESWAMGAPESELAVVGGVVVRRHDPEFAVFESLAHGGQGQVQDPQPQLAYAKWNLEGSCCSLSPQDRPLSASDGSPANGMKLGNAPMASVSETAELDPSQLDFPTHSMSRLERKASHASRSRAASRLQRSLSRHSADFAKNALPEELPATNSFERVHETKDSILNRWIGRQKWWTRLRRSTSQPDLWDEAKEPIPRQVVSMVSINEVYGDDLGVY